MKQRNILVIFTAALLLLVAVVATEMYAVGKWQASQPTASNIVTSVTSPISPISSNNVKANCNSSTNSFSPALATEIQDEYGHCDSASDCTVIHGTICGFVSGVATNKGEVDNVLPLITSCSPTPCYENRVDVSGIGCINNKCAFIPAKPSALFQ